MELKIYIYRICTSFFVSSGFLRFHDLMSNNNNYTKNITTRSVSSSHSTISDINSMFSILIELIFCHSLHGHKWEQSVVSTCNKKLQKTNCPLSFHRVATEFSNPFSYLVYVHAITIIQTCVVQELLKLRSKLRFIHIGSACLAKDKLRTVILSSRCDSVGQQHTPNRLVHGM